MSNSEKETQVRARALSEWYARSLRRFFEEVAVAGRDYLKFIGHSEGQVRDTVVAQRGSLEAQFFIAGEVKSVAAFQAIAEREQDPAVRARALEAAVAAWNDAQHRDVRLLSELPGWAKEAEDRNVALASMRLLARHARVAGGNDLDLLHRTGTGRDINRHNYTRAEILEQTERPVVRSLLALCRWRNTLPAFDGDIHVQLDGSVLTLVRHGVHDPTAGAEAVVDLVTGRTTLSWHGPAGSGTSSNLLTDPPQAQPEPSTQALAARG